MRPYDAAVLASRIIALYFGVQTAIFVVSILGGGGLPGADFWVPILTQAAVAVYLWFGAESVGRGLARGASAEPPATPRPLAHVRGVAISIVGIVFTGQAIPELVSVLTSEIGSFSPLSPYSFYEGATIGIVAKLVVGIALVVYGSSLIRSAPQVPGSSRETPADDA